MKKCTYCNTLLDDETTVCSSCGGSDLEPVVTAPETPEPVTVNPAVTPVETPVEPAPTGNGNIIAGLVGAVLFAALGGLIYFLIYQMGFIAGIVGLVTFVLASFGYDLFSRSKGTIWGVIISAVATFAAIYAAEYLCISFEIYNAFKELDITFFDAVRATSEFLKEPEIKSAMISDLVFAYIFGGLAVIGNIVSAAKAKKNAQ